MGGKIPSGLFNAMFGLQSDSWAMDAANIKYMALDGYFIILFNARVHMVTSWDPSALSKT